MIRYYNCIIFKPAHQEGRESGKTTKDSFKTTANFEEIDAETHKTRESIREERDLRVVGGGGGGNCLLVCFYAVINMRTFVQDNEWSVKQRSL